MPDSTRTDKYKSLLWANMYHQEHARSERLERALARLKRINDKWRRKASRELTKGTRP